MKKRIISIILAAVLLTSMLPVGVSAAGTNSLSLPTLEISAEAFDFSKIIDFFVKLKQYIEEIFVIDIFNLGKEDVISSLDVFSGNDTITLKAPEIANQKNSGNYVTKYQWYKCTDQNGAGAQAIDGANGDTLEITATQSKVFYSCKATLYLDTLLGEIKTFKSTRCNYTVAQTLLPTVYVNTADGKPVSSREEWEKADITITGCDNKKYNLEKTETKIKGRGNSSWLGAGNKNGYSIKFDSKQNLLGIGKDKKWALLANYYDKTLIRNWLAHELDNKIYDNEDFEVIQIPVDLYMNGEYVGNYYLSSTIKIGGNRIDIPDISDDLEEDVNGDKVIDLYDGGFVIEVDARKDASHYFSGNHSGVWFTLSDPDLDDEDEKNDAIFSHIQGIIQNVENVLYSENFADSETGYASVIDVDSFIDYYLVIEIAKNNDAKFWSSVHMYYDPSDGLIHMAPVWDFDIGFGNINYSACEDYHGLWCNGAWFGRLMQDPAYMEKLIDRWNETKEQVKDMVNNDIQAQADKLSSSASLNFMKWNVLGKYIWPAPAGYENRTTYQSEVDYLINWTNNRIEWLDGYFNGLE